MMPQAQSAVERQLRWLLRLLQQWLDDPRVTDIFVNGPNQVFVKHQGRTVRQDVHLTYDDRVDIGINAAALTRQGIGDDVPPCSTRLPDGHRVQFIRPPAVADRTYSISIRRPAATTPTLDDLEQAGVFSPTHVAGREALPIDRRLMGLFRSENWRAFLHMAVANGKNIVFAGEVGSARHTICTHSPIRLGCRLASSRSRTCRKSCACRTRMWSICSTAKAAKGRHASPLRT